MPSRLTILIVDDDADGRFLLERRLNRTFKECTIITCSSADEALPFLKRSQIDAIVTDHQLGAQSGCDFISQARRRGIMCPILMVTGSDDPQIERDAYQAGATKVFKGGRGDFADFLRTLLVSPVSASRDLGRPASG
jgi:CheY-like chemotaxis protein